MPNIQFVVGGQLAKYFGEQSPFHVGELTWPGYQGFPVINFDVNCRYDYPVLTLVHYFYNKFFDLNKPEDLEHYSWVSDRIVNGWFICVHREFFTENNQIKVYMEWVQRYLLQVPKDLLDKFYPVEPIEYSQLFETKY
jgi:hypothetical protein